MSKPIPSVQKFMTTSPHTIGRDQPMSLAQLIADELLLVGDHLGQIAFDIGDLWIPAPHAQSARREAMATRHSRSAARLMMAPAVVLLLGWMLVPLTMTLYFGGFAVAQLVAGPISDALGRRPVTFAFMSI